MANEPEDEMWNAISLYDRKFGKDPDLTTIMATGEEARAMAMACVKAVERGTELTEEEREALAPDIPEGAVI